LNFEYGKGLQTIIIFKKLEWKIGLLGDCLAFFKVACRTNVIILILFEISGTKEDENFRRN